MSNPNPPAPAASKPLWPRWLGLIAFAGYLAFIGSHTAVVAGGSDSSGYLNSGRLLSQGKLLTDLRPPPAFGPRADLDPMHFLPQGFFPFTDRTQLTPTYPTGLPLHFALAGKLFGWSVGPWLIVLLAAAAVVWLTYSVARALDLSAPLAIAGATVIAAFPVFIFAAIQPLSDTLATAWTLAALRCALFSRRSAHRAFAGALACGGALGLAVLVRPTNSLLAPALLILLGMNWRKLGLFALGGMPAALWLAFYNHQLYGGPFQSGYGEIFPAFALPYGAPTLAHFTHWLALLLPSVFLALPVFAWLRRDTRTRELLAVTLAFTAITSLYLFYEVSREVWWCLRFILPALPPLIFLGLIGIEALARGPGARWPHPFRTGAAALVGVWALALSGYWTPKLGVFLVQGYEQAYEQGSLAAREKLPPNAVIMSFAFSGSLYYYTDFPVLRWDQMDAPIFSNYAASAHKSSVPVCALLFDWEEKDAFTRCPGPWQRVATLANIGLWTLPPPQT